MTATAAAVQVNAHTLNIHGTRVHIAATDHSPALCNRSYYAASPDLGNWRAMQAPGTTWDSIYELCPRCEAKHQASQPAEVPAADPRAQVITEVLTAKYGQAVPVEAPMVDAILANLDGDTTTYVAPRLLAAVTDALAAAAAADHADQIETSGCCDTCGQLASQVLGTCVYCLHNLPVTALEPMNPAGNLACRDLGACEARQASERAADADDEMLGPQGDDTTSDLAYEDALDLR